ncbi:MAG: hypothetical protein Q7U98_00570 [Methylicorpusculum sp.]|uniref:hypothetical protein n=1 Tax=Methylicorpusculum sp. TaxID=2713644 RepID=UPI00271E2E59|nr:hypothetical protein [Methylicorpusculum sp.]MDO8937633.1 hypothetical protein [Methylicorpusculum sp.]MDP2201990.1 hypothetical protein [Methylicorpusculum sp.]
MDVSYFLQQRLKFIQQFYNMASAPFIDRKRLIEAEEEPFIPPYSESEYPEPYFLEEWIEANESIQVLGCLCISMLSNVFKTYFEEWERLIGMPKNEEIKNAFNKGFLNGYKAYFAEYYNIRFEESPAKLAILEEITLARNKTQHTESIVSNTHSYSYSELKKLRPPFFINNLGRSLFNEATQNDDEWFEFLTLFEDTSMQITGEKLFAAISEIERFTEWLETKKAQQNNQL